MARWPLLALALLSLAGCTSSPPGDGAAEGSQEVPPQDAAQTMAPVPVDPLVFHGELKGVGMRTPDGGWSFTGISESSDDFKVQPGTHLDILLEWNVTAPAWIFLVVYPPSGERVELDGLPGSAVSRSIRYQVEDAEAGQWSVNAHSIGPAAIDFTLTVTFDGA